MGWFGKVSKYCYGAPEIQVPPYIKYLASFRTEVVIHNENEQILPYNSDAFSQTRSKVFIKRIQKSLKK